MKWKRRTTILTCLAAAVAGCSAGPRVESLTGSEAYIAQDPDLSCRSLVTQDFLDYCCGVGGYVGLGGDGLTGDLDGDLA